MMDEWRRFFTLFGFALAALSLHGPVIGHTDYNGPRYLIGPWLCPPLLAALYSLRPFKPYRSGAARYAGMVDYDCEDGDAQRLSRIFASHEARQFLFRAAARLSTQLFALMALMMILHWRLLTWSVTSLWLAHSLIGAWIGSFVALMSQFTHWGIERWMSADA